MTGVQMTHYHLTVQHPESDICCLMRLQLPFIPSLPSSSMMIDLTAKEEEDKARSLYQELQGLFRKQMLATQTALNKSKADLQVDSLSEATFKGEQLKEQNDALLQRLKDKVSHAGIVGLSVQPAVWSAFATVQP